MHGFDNCCNSTMHVEVKRNCEILQKIMPGEGSRPSIHFPSENRVITLLLNQLHKYRITPDQKYLLELWCSEFIFTLNVW